MCWRRVASVIVFVILKKKINIVKNEAVEMANFQNCIESNVINGTFIPGSITSLGKNTIINYFSFSSTLTSYGTEKPMIWDSSSLNFK